MAREDTFLRLVFAAVIVVAVVLGGAFVKIYVIDRKPPEPEAPPPPPPPRPVTVDPAEVERSIERTLARLNILGVVANVMDMRARPFDAARVRNTMNGLEQALAQLGALRPETSTPDCLRGRDIIVRFRTFLLSDFERPDAEKFLTDFLKHLRVGSRARVETRDRAVEIVVRELPDDWPELVAPALEDAPPPEPSAQPPPPVPQELTPAQHDAIAVLMDPSRRARGDDRLQAIYELRRLSEISGTSGNWYAAARLMLERRGDDRALTEYFATQRIPSIETFGAAEHIAAALWLAARGGEVPRLLALGHMADAWRRGAGAEKGFVKALADLNFMRADQPLGCGPPADVAALAMASAIRQGTPQRAVDSLSLRFKPVKQDAALHAVAGYAAILAGRDPTLKARLEQQAAACADPDDAALLRMLAGAAGGPDALVRTPCARCRERGTLIPSAALRCDRCRGLGFALSRPPK